MDQSVQCSISISHGAYIMRSLKKIDNRQNVFFKNNIDITDIDFSQKARFSAHTHLKHPKTWFFHCTGEKDIHMHKNDIKIRICVVRRRICSFSRITAEIKSANSEKSSISTSWVYLNMIPLPYLCQTRCCM